MKNIPWHTKLVFVLTVLLPIYFMIAALGSKIGLWSWMVGLGAMTITAGPFLIGIVAIVALVSLIIGLIKKPRRLPVLAVGAIGLIIPLGMFASLGSMASVAGANPIHDVATDTANPPSFSAATMAEREMSESNALNDYQVPLGELEAFKSLNTAEPELAIKSHAQIINDTYAGLSPLPLGGASKADAVAAVAAAMGEMGLTDIRPDAENGIVEGVDVTFWYGFKDDVVARIGEQQIDFRSVSRVGRSDLGANAKRIAELREKVAAQIGQR